MRLRRSGIERNGSSVVPRVNHVVAARNLALVSPLSLYPAARDAPPASRHHFPSFAVSSDTENSKSKNSYLLAPGSNRGAPEANVRVKRSVKEEKSREAFSDVANMYV